MEFFINHVLTIVVFVPTVGGALLLLHRLFRSKDAGVARGIALMTSAVTFIFSLTLIVGYHGGHGGMQFKEQVTWIRSFGLNVDYRLGMDGLSLWLVVLTAVLTIVSVLCSWRAITAHVHEFFIFLLLLETGVLGVFVSLDLFLFYLFWEVMLVPMYFLIGIWGGEQRIYAAIKFIIYTMAGSVLMLVAIISLYYLNGQATGEYTFDLIKLTDNLNQGALRLDPRVEMWLFLGFAIAFFIKVPLFPLHTWLPDAHVEAPTAGSVMLAGVLLKMGGYGLLRFNLPMFPHASAEWTTPICILAVIAIIYGALVAMVQPDVKKLVAYSSVSHMGFVVLGTFAATPQGLHGAVFQMLSHGVSTGALFLCVGVLYERRHTRMIADFGGLAGPMPVFAGLFGVITLASIGLPLLSGFVGEFLVLAGTFTSTIAHARLFAVLASSGMVLSAVYMLWMFQRVIFGEVTNKANAKLPDVNWRERAYLAPMVVLALALGVAPNWFLRKTDSTVYMLWHRMISATTAAEDRGWKIEDRGWRIEDRGDRVQTEVSMLDPQSSILESQRTERNGEPGN